MRHRILISAACAALMFPHRAMTQHLADSPVGVVHLGVASQPTSVVPRLLPDTTDGPPPTRAGRIIMGGMLGALSGVLVTTLVVSYCEAHDTSHGDGPGCGIGVAVIGPPAVLIGASLGIIIADW